MDLHDPKNKVMQHRAWWREQRALQKRKLLDVALSFPVTGAGAFALCVILFPSVGWNRYWFEIILSIAFYALVGVLAANSKYLSPAAAALSFLCGMLFSASTFWPPEDTYERIIFVLAIVHLVPFLVFLIEKIVLWCNPGLSWLNRADRAIRWGATATGAILLTAAAPLLIMSVMYILAFLLVVVLAGVNAYSVAEGAKKYKNAHGGTNFDWGLWDWQEKQIDLIPIATEKAWAKFWVKVAVVMLALAGFGALVHLVMS